MDWGEKKNFKWCISKTMWLCDKRDVFTLFQAGQTKKAKKTSKLIGLSNSFLSICKQFGMDRPFEIVP